MDHRNRTAGSRIKRRFFGFLAVCCMLMAAVPSLYGGGNRDPDLSQADELIKDKRYDDAIQVLAAYIRSNPDNFEQAQRRLHRIVKIRGDFNATVDELLITMTDDSQNVEKILSLIAYLEALESSRNPMVQAFIARTRELAQFTFNRNRLVRILEEGRRQVEAGNYQGALVTYAGGLDIYQDEFFAAGYGGIIENRVWQGIEDITNVVENFSSLTGPLDAAAAEMIRTVQQGGPDSGAVLSRIEEVQTRLVPAMDRVIALQRTLYTTARYFDEQLAQFQQLDRSIGDRSFLSFASRLLRGNAAGDGMLGAVEAYWNDVVSRVEYSLAGLAGQSYAAALEDARKRDYGKSREELGAAGGYIRYPLALLNKWREFGEAGNLPERVFFDQPVSSGKAGDFLQYQSMARALPYLVEGTGLGREFESSLAGTAGLFESWQRNAAGAGTPMTRETGGRDAGGGFLAEIDELLAGIGAEIAVLKIYRAGITAAEGGDMNALAYIDEANSLLRDLRGLMISQDQESAVRFYTMANNELERRLNSRNAEYEEGNRFIEGVPRDTGSRDANIDYFPMEGLAVLSRMEQELAADTRWGTALLGQYGAEPRELLEAGEVKTLYSTAQTLYSGLENLLTRGRRLAAAARNQMAQAETFRLDGERLLQEARVAVGRNNFDTARDRLQRAAERFNSSLEIQESASLRAEWDTQLINLGAEINRMENQIVIRDVRDLVNNARTSYFAGNFEQAEELLVRAQNRWRVTNVGEDVEVQYWLTVVRGALSLRSGRVIAPTAPLYAEMSQLLSDARKNYEEGVRFINSGRRADGLAKFTEARQKTRDVKLMFPVNQEAGILELRMDQLTDPEAFTESFIRRFNEAVAGTKRQSVESFADLQNLAEINPRYPGIAAALVQAEIDMGYRPPPPDPRALARSNELTTAARRILEGNVGSQFEVALRQLNEALTLNPNNTQAMTTKDQIQTRMNGTGTTVLDSHSESEYQRAVRELQRGNTLVAMAIVQQLLQNPRNSASTRILDLQRRIQSVL
jgi:tetratricopeptide (TPR) repeat protein